MRSSDEIEAALTKTAGQEASPEHLLSIVADSGSGSRLLRACGVDLDRLRGELDALGRLRTAPRRQEALFLAILQRATLHATVADRDQITAGDLLAASLAEPSHASGLLQRLGVTRLRVLRALCHGSASFASPPPGPTVEQLSVLLHNDDYTTMEFVEQVLTDVFGKSAADATDIMFDVHREGVARVGSYPREQAQKFVLTVLERAAAEEFPLLCTLAPAGE